MPETLLSQSRILLFGRTLDDLRFMSSATAAFSVVAATVDDLKAADLKGLDPVDGVDISAGDKVLVRTHRSPKKNGIHSAATTKWSRDTNQPNVGDYVSVAGGDENQGIWVRKATKNPDNFVFSLFSADKFSLGDNNFLADQKLNGMLARIYGFSYEGAYYDLPKPALFLVHGEGDPAVLPSQAAGTAASLTRAPRETSLSGVAAADYQLADDLRVWSYDKADYTVRMDVETGMFEDILLDPFFAGDGGGVSGARISGARVSGARVSGARVSGARVSGARLSGGRGDATD